MQSNCATNLPCLLTRGLGRLPELLEEGECPSRGEVLRLNFDDLMATLDALTPLSFRSLEPDASVPTFATGPRCYDPTPGRWDELEPFGFAAGEANLYRYVSDQRGILIDEDGTIRDA